MVKTISWTAPISLHSVFLTTVAVALVQSQFVQTSPISPDPMKKECGELICTRHEYCSPIDHLCHSCDIVCDKQSNNFDFNRCNEDCQDYLHDLIYQRNDDMKIENELWTLKLLVAVTLALTTLTLLVLFIIFFMKVKRWKYHKKRNSATLPSVIYNNNQREKPVPMRTRPVSTAAHLPQSQLQRKNDANSRDNTLGSLSSREPSESALPEYSYDNPALAPSPTSHI